MATYKLIQDIEAEDHILGPLTLKQFLFALAAAFSWYMCFIGYAKHIWVVLGLFLPIAAFASFFAVPFHGDQPTEIWAAARFRFLFLPRRRIWDQSAVKQVVTITVPKKVEIIRTDGLSQNEVKSRLHALANTIDSRGWAVKNVTADVYRDPFGQNSNSDRLLNIDQGPQEVPTYEFSPREDVLDITGNNPIAQQFDQMINASETAHRQRIIQEMNAAAQTASQDETGWFMNQQGTPAVTTNQDSLSPAAEDALLSAELKGHHKQTDYDTNMHSIKPLQDQTDAVATDSSATITNDRAADASAAVPIPDPIPEPPKPVAPAPLHASNVNLAGNNDLNIATLAHEAKKQNNLEDGEIIISLH